MQFRIILLFILCVCMAPAFGTDKKTPPAPTQDQEQSQAQEQYQYNSMDQKLDNFNRNINQMRAMEFCGTAESSVTAGGASMSVQTVALCGAYADDFYGSDWQIGAAWTIPIVNKKIKNAIDYEIAKLKRDADNAQLLEAVLKRLNDQSREINRLNQKISEREAEK